MMGPDAGEMVGGASWGATAVMTGETMLPAVTQVPLS